ncbi:hypothetical protein PLESTB_001721100 [Pleodorina starrii]|uniref:Uncharacterized protein n=1 Tax=Pleodorina starrii TaxID=330485 RepID=A0A9W6BZU2_9CHLO|nr:hypothetical protein PLESTB_001721100 [Pleodorina starrii]GLC69544.1 hypothetical protein PLESTF_000845500 [Pleodorina starrii]
MQDLLLLVPERTTNVRHLTADDEPIGAGRDDSKTGPYPGNVSQHEQVEHEPPHPTPQPLPSRLSSAPSPPSLADWCRRVSSRLSALPPDAALSFPVLRRLLTAVVVRTWLDGWREGGRRMMSQADEEAARALLVQVGAGT